MSKSTTLAVALAAALTLSGVGVGVASAYAPTPCPMTPCPAVTTPAAANLPSAAVADLVFSREEEKMSRELYSLFADEYDGARPFSNITRSEQRHYDAIGRLLTRYGAKDPAAGKPAGVYTSPEVQRLYDTWKAQGLKSQQAALQVGVDLEKRDIADLERLIARTTAPDVKQVYTHLLAGSRNHLAAFTNALDGGRRGMDPGTRVVPAQANQPGPAGQQGRHGGRMRSPDRSVACPNR